MKKIFDFIIKAFMTLQAIIAVTMLIITQIMDTQDSNEELIISLLTIIVVDFFVFARGYLEQIEKHTGDLYKLLDKKGVSVDFVKRTEFNQNEYIKTAQHDVFISGTTLTHLVSEKDLFSNIGSSIDVKFLLMDIENQEVLRAFRKMRYNSSGSVHTDQRYINQGNMFKDLYNALKTQRNIKFAVADRIMPITFVAIDIEKISSNTMIKVQHYLYEKEADQATISYIVRPGNEMFDLYKEEIQILWNNSIRDVNKLYFARS